MSSIPSNPIGDIFDTRDLQRYLEFVEELLINNWNKYKSVHNTSLQEAITINDIDFEMKEFHDEYYEDIKEYTQLKQFSEELASSPDYKYGQTVISDFYWVNYCKEFCQDVGYIPRNTPSWIEIDWEATADNLSKDYNIVEYKGEDYLIRL